MMITVDFIILFPTHRNTPIVLGDKNLNDLVLQRATAFHVFFLLLSGWELLLTFWTAFCLFPLCTILSQQHAIRGFDAHVRLLSVRQEHVFVVEKVIPKIALAAYVVFTIRDT